MGTSVVPVMRYRDVAAAIDWLGKAFGFAIHRVTGGANGAIMFAQLTFGTAMIMVGPVRQSAFDRLLKQPDEIGGAETQVCYFFVADARAHCARARAAGAEIVFSIEDEGRGGASYSCRDPEGHLWNFGTYNPWQRQALAKPSRSPPSARRPFVLLTGLAILAAAAIAAAGGLTQSRQNLVALASKGLTSVPGAQAPQAPRPREEAPAPPSPEAAVAAAERLASEAREQMRQAVSAKEAAEQLAGAVQERLSRALIEKEAAEQLGKQLQERLVQLWLGKNAADRAAKEARRQLAKERSARRAAEIAQPPAQARGPAAPSFR
jgi:uncharacterized glyoxalase superfamily protein PhnB